MAGLFEELRRSVFRTGIAYVVPSWLLAQAADIAADPSGAPAPVRRRNLLSRYRAARVNG